MEYLGRVGMTPYIHARPAQLSGGQKQRVAIARALAMEPEVLLFDEPTSALDPQMVGEVLDVMRSLAGDGLTMIVVTHEMAFARDVSHERRLYGRRRHLRRGTPRRIFLKTRRIRRRANFSRASSWGDTKDRSAATRCGLRISARPVDTRRTALV